MNARGGSKRRRIGAGRGPQAGLSLVELMVALAVGLFLLAGILQLLVSTKVSYTAEENLARLQANGRYILQAIARDARMARNMGCRSLLVEEILETIQVGACSMRVPTVDADGEAICTGTPVIASDSPIGHDGSQLSSDNWGSLPASVQTNWLRGDVLDLWGVSGPGTYMTQDQAQVLTIARTEDIVLETRNDVFQVGDPLLITDCEGSDLFTLSDVTHGDDSTTLGHGLTSTHGEGDDATTTDANETDALSRAYNNIGSGLTPGTRINAMVFPFERSIYFICSGNDTRPESLCRWRASSGRSEALVGDVKDMRVTFYGDGIDAERADQLSGAEWTDVTSAQVELLVASEEEVRTGAASPSDGSWEGGGTDRLGAGLASDRRLYQRFASTVAFRAQAPWYLE